MKELKNKVVWITGASSGIGEALAHAFAKLGSKVVLSSRKEADLKKVVSDAGLGEEDCLVVPLDLEKYDGYEVLAAEVMAKFGRIDVLINNGGVSQRSYFAETELGVFERIMKINFMGTVALTKAVLPFMAAQRSGVLVTVSSVTGKFGTPLRTGYAGSKHAVVGFYDALRAEVWKDGLEVLIVCPGYIKTKLSLNAFMGDGSLQGKMDSGQKNGLSPELCAHKIISAIKKGKREIYPGGFKEVAGVYLKRFFPALMAKVVRKVNVR
ncbi:SDR family oxidoreductase [Flammeovirgaceae bacterium SG7u.111]|nr:SDR family oxidoreductase [Flammeovirgaceae bacterium SG7u.132]WPO35453.1 SDR family oxidoreductase [Flammeovirgaceae bacterium SG7u.111]